MPTQLSEEQKKAQAKAKADAKAKEDAKKDEKIEPVDFVRRETRPGIYSTKALGNEIKIVDRGHYYAKTQVEIDFLNEDPEIIVFNSGKKNKKK